MCCIEGTTEYRARCLCKTVRTGEERVVLSIECRRSTVYAAGSILGAKPENQFQWSLATMGSKSPAPSDLSESPRVFLGTGSGLFGPHPTSSGQPRPGQDGPGTQKLICSLFSSAVQQPWSYKSHSVP